MNLRFALSKAAVAAVVAIHLGSAGSAAGAAPKVGERAPDFVLSASTGAQIALADFVGKRGVVLAWFPKAFTPG